MTMSDKELGSVIPDLRDLPLERLTEVADSVLAHSIALYRQRLKENAVPLSSFTARILGVTEPTERMAHLDPHTPIVRGCVRSTS